MARVAYFDCFAGASGDMIVGALVDLGADFAELSRALGSLGVQGFECRTERVFRGGLATTKFCVDVQKSAQAARNLAHIRSIIEASSLSENVKKRSLATFELIADAEARVHGTTPDAVHFHEVGAVDSIVDIVAAMKAVELLRLETFVCSPLRLGRGTVSTEHGVLPVPAPATVLLVQGMPVYAGEIDGEFVTPTGAAILRTLCGSFGSMPLMRIDRAGYGAGSRDPKNFPNAMRIITGEAGAFLRKLSGRAEEGVPIPEERVIVIETNIDDMNPQVFSYVLERALALGARDAYLTPVQMKKGRPGTLLTVVCDPGRLDELSSLLLVETATLGVRYYEAARRVLERTIETVVTPYGEIRVKVARDGDRTLHFQPEFDDCALRAAEHGVPLIEVQSAAAAAFRLLNKSG
jgi:uncharacterized protein (TIGR00299 family) protein